jgi:hypothetical protein
VGRIGLLGKAMTGPEVGFDFISKETGRFANYSTAVTHWRVPTPPQAEEGEGACPTK